MKAIELRIGNYISVKNMGVDLPAIIERGVEIDAANEYNPVPLTEELLLKAGFSSDGYKDGYIGKDFVSGQMTLSFVLCNPFAKGDWNDCYTFDLRDSMFKSLRYVHELQNLYFLLTNSELQFTS